MRTSITTSLFPTQISLEALGCSFYPSGASEFSQNWWAYGLNYTNVFNLIRNSEAGPVTPNETSLQIDRRMTGFGYASKSAAFA